MSFPVPPEVFIVVLKYLTYKDIVNLTEVNQYTYNLILRYLPKKNLQDLEKLIDMKNINANMFQSLQDIGNMS